MTPPLVIRDTPTLLVRELETGDGPAIAYLFRHLGERSRYQRFLHPKRELSPAELAGLTAVDHWHHDAVIAFSALPRRPVGVARYVRSDNFDVAELAVTVVDDWQRRGVGSTLVAVLSEHAARAGIRRLTATVLRENRGALALAHRLGHPVVLHAGGGTIEIAFACR